MSFISGLPILSADGLERVALGALVNALVVHGLDVLVFDLLITTWTSVTVTARTTTRR
jgi:hypothetical protein